VYVYVCVCACVRVILQVNSIVIGLANLVLNRLLRMSFLIKVGL